MPKEIRSPNDEAPPTDAAIPASSFGFDSDFGFRISGLRTTAVCAALLLAFYTASLVSVRTKSATYDEPMHLAGALAHVRQLDFRINMEDPPLWHYVAALPHLFSPPTLPTDHPAWQAMPVEYHRQWEWSIHTLYRTPANDADTLLNRSRAVMLILGLALGALIARWAWQLAGPVAAIVATTLFSLDPNFTAHAPLVKNDVPFTLAFTATAYALWLLGQRATPLRLLLAGLACGAALSTKFTGLLLPPIIILALITRALLPSPWPVFSKTASTLKQRFLTTLVLIAGIGLIAYIVLWSSYGFRYRPTADPDLRLNMPALRALAASREIAAQHPDRPPNPSELRAWQPGLLIRFIDLADEHHLLPHPWLAGLLYTHATTQARTAFLLGQESNVGWWSYFPLAILMKTPTATLLAMFGAFFAAISTFIARPASPLSPSPGTPGEGRGEGLTGNWQLRTRAPAVQLLTGPADTTSNSLRLTGNWQLTTGNSLLLLPLPPTLYLLSLLTSNTNIGLRHALPLYPFLFLAISLAASAAWTRWKPGFLATAPLLALALLLESALAFPHYLSFFNAPSLYASPNGLMLLADSNLDWGQDLKLLQHWRTQNPAGPLYLAYFGTADPAYYSLNYTNLPHGYPWGTPPQPLSPHLPPGHLALSATHLQLALNDPTSPYRPFLSQDPIAVLGRSIYIYKFP